MTLRLPDGLGKGPGQSTWMSLGPAEGPCSWRTVSAKQVVRDGVRRLLGQSGWLCGPFMAPRGGTLLEHTGHGLACNLLGLR